MSVALNDELMIRNNAGVLTVTLDRRRKATHRYATLLSFAAIPAHGDVEVAAMSNLSDVFPVEKMQQSEALKTEVIKLLATGLLAPLLQSILKDLQISATALMEALTAVLLRQDDNLEISRYLVEDEGPMADKKNPKQARRPKYSRPYPDKYPPPVMYPLSQKAAYSLMWTMVAVTYDMASLPEPELPADVEHPEYADRIDDIIHTAEIVERFFVQYGPHGTDEIDTYGTLEYVAEAMICKYQEEQSYKLSHAEVWDCLDWHRARVK